jgi:hypothetical protein
LVRSEGCSGCDGRGDMRLFSANGMSGIEAKLSSLFKARGDRAW